MLPCLRAGTQCLKLPNYSMEFGLITLCAKFYLLALLLAAGDYHGHHQNI